MDSWQEMLIQSLLTMDTEADLFAVLVIAANELDFEYCAFGMHLPLPISKPKVFMMNNYREAWQQRYQQQNYWAIDPTVAHGKRSVLPLCWSENIFANCRPFWEEANAHGLRAGWAQSCHDAKGVGGLLTLARSDDDLSSKELEKNSLKMSWLAQTAHESMARIILPKLLPELPIDLSVREIEVLRWTADGKTSGDISAIIGISERTVNFHLNNVMVKLGVYNKTAAAVKAAMLGLL